MIVLKRLNGSRIAVVGNFAIAETPECPVLILSGKEIKLAGSFDAIEAELSITSLTDNSGLSGLAHGGGSVLDDDSPALRQDGIPEKAQLAPGIDVGFE